MNELIKQSIARLEMMLQFIQQEVDNIKQNIDSTPNNNINIPNVEKTPAESKDPIQTNLVQEDIETEIRVRSSLIDRIEKVNQEIARQKGEHYQHLEDFSHEMQAVQLAVLPYLLRF